MARHAKVRNALAAKTTPAQGALCCWMTRTPVTQPGANNRASPGPCTPAACARRRAGSMGVPPPAAQHGKKRAGVAAGASGGASWTALRTRRKGECCASASDATLALARHGSPHGAGVRVWVWTASGLCLREAARAPGALWPHAVCPRRLGGRRAAARCRAAARGAGAHPAKRAHAHQSTAPPQAVRASYAGLCQDGTAARSGAWPLHASVGVWTSPLRGPTHVKHLRRVLSPLTQPPLWPQFPSDNRGSPGQRRRAVCWWGDWSGTAPHGPSVSRRRS